MKVSSISSILHISSPRADIVGVSIWSKITSLRVVKDTNVLSLNISFVCIIMVKSDRWYQLSGALMSCQVFCFRVKVMWSRTFLATAPLIWWPAFVLRALQFFNSRIFLLRVVWPACVLHAKQFSNSRIFLSRVGCDLVCFACTATFSF